MRQTEAGQVRKCMGEIALRLVLSFTIASACLVGGLFLLGHAFVAKFFSMDAVGLGVVFSFIGGAWLWADFVRPALRGEKFG
jgi:hypothetical protein